jgi:CheY-like chemotaxis protein
VELKGGIGGAWSQDAEIRSLSLGGGFGLQGSRVLKGSTMVFLVVDDNPRMRESIRRFLSMRVPDNHTVYEASEGGEAIRAYDQLHPDWVLMDIAMEPMDGLDASREIIRAHPDAKIIVLTNYGEAQYRQIAREIGVHAFVLKEHLSHVIPIVFPSLGGPDMQ